MFRVRILSGFEMIGSFAGLHPDTMGGTSLPPTLYRKMTQLDSHRSASSECEIGRMMEQPFTPFVRPLYQEESLFGRWPGQEDRRAKLLSRVPRPSSAWAGVLCRRPHFQPEKNSSRLSLAHSPLRLDLDRARLPGSVMQKAAPNPVFGPRR